MQVLEKLGRLVHELVFSMSVESKLKLYWIGLVNSLLLKNVVHGPDKVVMEENDDKDPVPTKDNPIKTRWQSILVKWKKQHPKQSNTSKAQQAYIEWAEHLVQDVMATHDMGPDGRKEMKCSCF